MTIDHENLTAISGKHPVILLTFSQSNGRSGAVHECEKVTPGIADLWRSIDREQVLKDNGMVVSTKLGAPIIILIPNRSAYMTKSGDIGVAADKAGRLMRQLGIDEVSLSVEQMSAEKVNRPSALDFIDRLERAGLTVHVYQQGY